MKLIGIKLWLLAFCGIFLSFVQQSFAQQVSIELGADQIALNQAFTIKVTVHNERLSSYEGFPEIDGFAKRGTSSASSTNYINGKMTFSQSITQNYVPLREGTIVLRPFEMLVNGKTVASPGKSIRVGPAMQRRQSTDPFMMDPFEEFFGRPNTPKEFVDVKEEAFLALTTDKKEVYLGEGFTTTLAFYVGENNRAQMQFYDLGKQITEIVKKIKPSNCWEENFNIDNITQEPVMINNKRYSQYKIYQATYYPLNTETIDFPTVGLELIKYKIAKNRTFYGQNRKEDFKTFYSSPKAVRVKALPPHPLRDGIAVGNYRLEERISSPQLKTGQSFNYAFRVMGEGNISAIDRPAADGDEVIDFYAPNIQQNITRSNGRVRGTKSFSYFGIPNEPGEYDLGEYFQWVFFNPTIDNYDTLRSQVNIFVTGESKRDEIILANDLGSFYDVIEFEDNQLLALQEDQFFKLFANILILIMLVLTAIFIFRK